MVKSEYLEYESNVLKDIDEVKEVYPFSKIIRFPTNNFSMYGLSTIAVSKEIIDETNGKEGDFIRDYSRRLTIEIPFNYKNKGCNIFCENWAKSDKIPYSDRHFNEIGNRTTMCVGVPNSFKDLDNVILENIKTADNILEQYAEYLQGSSKTIRLRAYSHGKKGEQEYEQEKYRKRKRNKYL